jgi:hypothetical protein
MLVRLVWRDCGYRGKRWGAEPIDAFWVEATAEEAEAEVFPLLRPEQVAESRKRSEEGRSIADRIGSPARPFCFLVARDLSTIAPFHVHYPFSPMWNAYSPFRPMPECWISRLEEVAGLSLPEDEP